MPVELIVGAAIGAAATSSRVRQAVRRGLIYGVGGVLVAYDKLSAAAHGVAQSAREAAASAQAKTTAETNGSSATAPETSASIRPAAPSPPAGTPA